MHDTAIIRPNFDLITEHRDDFPLAYLVAQQLKPILAQGSQDLTGHGEKSHAAALARADVIPDKLMDTVTRTMEQLQQQIFALGNRHSPFDKEAKDQLKA